MRKIVLLHPVTPDHRGFIRIGRCQTQTQPGGNAWPPIDLALIGACLKKKNADYNVVLYDAQLDKDYDAMLNRIKESGADVFIWNCTTPTFFYDLELARRIKAMNQRAFLIFFGLHAVTLPDEIMAAGAVDCCVTDEAEEVIADICEAYFSLGRDALRTVPNIVFRSAHGEVITTVKKAVNVNFLHERPDRSLLKNDQYILQYNNKPFTIIQTSKGCPGRCIYCTASLYTHAEIRRSAASVVEEIKEIIQAHNIRSILFLSDTFTMNREWVKELCRRILEERLEISWMANSRIDRIDLETMRLMKEAGCWLLSLGIESGSDKILQGARKGINRAQISRAVCVLHDLGIQTIGYFMFGLPGETKETIRETIAFSKELPLDFAYFFLATPFPGTELYRMAEEKGWLVTKDWRQYAHGANALLRYEGLSGQTLKGSVRKAYRSFYLRPSWMMKQFRHIASFDVFLHYVQAAFAILRK